MRYVGNSSLFPIFASAELITPGHQGEPGHAPKGDAPVSATLNTPAGRHSPGTRSTLSTGQSQCKGARRTSITNLVSDRSHQVRWVTRRHKVLLGQSGK